MFSVQSRTSFSKRGFLTSSVKIHGNMSPSRRVAEQDDLVDKSFPIPFRSNVVEDPFTCQLHVISTPWVLYIRYQLVVCHYCDDSMSSKVVADICPTLDKCQHLEILFLAERHTFSLQPLSPEKKPLPCTKSKTSLSAPLLSG